MQRKAIHISYALHELKISTEPVVLTYVRATGKRRGSITTKKALYGHYKPTAETSASTTRTYQKYQAGENKRWGKIPVINTEKGKTETLFVSHLIGFNEYIIKH